MATSVPLTPPRSSLLQFFVLCHSLLQLSQLLVSGYMKSSISTIERRYGLSSQKSGMLAAFNEVGGRSAAAFRSFHTRDPSPHTVVSCPGGKHGPHHLCEFLWESSPPSAVHRGRGSAGLPRLPGHGLAALPERTVRIHRPHQS